MATLQIVVPEEVTAEDLDVLKQLKDGWTNPVLRSDLAW